MSRTYHQWRPHIENIRYIIVPKTEVKKYMDDSRLVKATILLDDIERANGNKTLSSSWISNNNYYDLDFYYQKYYLRHKSRGQGGKRKYKCCARYPLQINKERRQCVKKEIDEELN